MCELGPEIAGQDEHALVVGTAGEVGLALDINDAPAAGRHGGGDLSGVPEPVITQVINGQPVQLSDAGSVNIDHDYPVADQLTDLRLHETQAIYTLRYGSIDVLLPNHFITRLARPKAGLADQVRDIAESRAQLVLAAGKPNALLHHRRYRSGIEGWDLLLVGHPGHELRVALHRLIVTFHDAIEVGLDLEDLAEVGIQGIEDLIRIRVSQQHHLHVNLDDLWLHRRRYEKHRVVTLNVDLVVLEGALQRLVDAGLGEHVEQRHDQVAAIGQEKTSRFDACEVGLRLP